LMEDMFTLTGVWPTRKKQKVTFQLPSLSQKQPTNFPSVI
jgi:hypothetical protein